MPTHYKAIFLVFLCITWRSWLDWIIILLFIILLVLLYANSKSSVIFAALTHFLPCFTILFTFSTISNRKDSTTRNIITWKTTIPSEELHSWLRLAFNFTLNFIGRSFLIIISFYWLPSVLSDFSYLKLDFWRFLLSASV